MNEIKQKILNALNDKYIHNINEAGEYIKKFEGGFLEECNIKWKVVFDTGSDSLSFQNDEDLIEWCNTQRETYFGDDEPDDSHYTSPQPNSKEGGY